MLKKAFHSLLTATIVTSKDRHCFLTGKVIFAELMECLAQAWPQFWGESLQGTVGLFCELME